MRFSEWKQPAKPRKAQGQMRRNRQGATMQDTLVGGGVTAILKSVPLHCVFNGMYGCIHNS